MSFFEILALMVVASIIPLLAVMLGGWLVFRTRNAQLGIPMIGETPKKGAKPSRYVDLQSMGIGNESLMDQIEKDMSPAAKRYRKVANLDDVRAAVTGAK